MELQLNGARIHYRRSGAGFPLLLVHAGIADSRMWEPQAAAFGGAYDVLRPDMRGFGDSELPPATYSWRADLAALLDALAIERTHIIGCSMGGSAAIDFTLEHPQRVERLVLVGAGVSGANLGAADQDLFADIEAADKAGDIEATNRAEVRLWVDGPRRPEGSVTPEVRQLVLDMNGRALHSNFEAATDEKLDLPAVGRLGEIGAPTLVIVGDEDLPHALVAAELIASSIRGARKVVMHDAAHLPSLERPEAFNRLVLDFLNA